MTWMGTRAIVALAAAMLAAGMLAACGGSDSSTAGGSTATEKTEAASESDTRQGDTKDSQSADNGAKQNGGSSQSGSGASGSGEVSTPLKVSGGGSEQFRSKGGDNSIQEFGEESDESELEAAAQALHSFYVSRAEEEWTRACSFLTSSMQQQLEQLATQSPQLKGRDCGALLHAFTRPLPASVRRETTVVDAGSLRDDGEQAFLIYRAIGGTAYAMPMKEEDGEWKVGLLAATPVS